MRFYYRRSNNMRVWTAICCTALLTAITTTAGFPASEFPSSPRARPKVSEPALSPRNNADDLRGPEVSRPAPPERRGKYANPYDRSIPYQGDVHRNYKYGKKDPYKRH